MGSFLVELLMVLGHDGGVVIDMDIMRRSDWQAKYRGRRASLINNNLKAK